MFCSVSICLLNLWALGSFSFILVFKFLLRPFLIPSINFHRHLTYHFNFDRSKFLGLGRKDQFCSCALKKRSHTPWSYPAQAFSFGTMNWEFQVNETPTSLFICSIPISCSYSCSNSCPYPSKLEFWPWFCCSTFGWMKKFDQTHGLSWCEASLWICFFIWSGLVIFQVKMNSFLSLKIITPSLIKLIIIKWTRTNSWRLQPSNLGIGAGSAGATDSLSSKTSSGGGARKFLSSIPGPCFLICTTCECGLLLMHLVDSTICRGFKKSINWTTKCGTSTLTRFGREYSWW